MVTDFSAGALPIGVKFCMAVQPHLRQVFYFGEIAPGTAELWASTGAIWRDILLAEACVTPLTGHPHIVASTVGFPVGNCRNTAGNIQSGV